MKSLVFGFPLLLIVSVSLVVILVFIAVGQYAYPSADDFCMATGVRDYGLLTHLWQHYLEWSGRYAGNAFYALYPMLFGLFDGYPAIGGLLTISLVMAMAFFIASLFRLRIYQPAVLLVALVFTAVYLLGLRHTASSLYWLAGALTYQTANILLLLTMGGMLVLREQQENSQRLVPIMMALIVLVVLGMGTNEINMIVTTIVVASAYVLSLRMGEGNKSWLLLLLVALACFAIVYFSPGNTVRQETFPLRHDLARSLGGSLRMGSWTLMAWLGNPVFITASLLVPFASLWLYLTSGRYFQISTGFLLALALFTLCMPYVLQFPAWWAMGGWPPPRTVDAIFFVFMLSWILLLGSVSIRFISTDKLFFQQRTLRRGATVVLLVIAVLFVITVVINSRFQRAYGDLLQRASPFSAYMMERHELIRKTLGQGQYSLQVPAYPADVPRSIYFNDIRPNWRDWRNVCYANFFGLRAIQRERGGRMNRQESQRPSQRL